MVAREIERWKALPEILRQSAPGPNGTRVLSDPLSSWRVNHASYSYPHVAKVARKYLCIPASSAPSERVFSLGKLVLERRRWNMTPA